MAVITLFQVFSRVKMDCQGGTQADISGGTLGEKYFKEGGFGMCKPYTGCWAILINQR